MKLLKTVNIILERWYDGVVILVASVLIFMMLAISYDVAMRYFFNNPTTWVLGITPVLILWITFLGGGWLLRKDGHVRIDIILHSLSPGKRRILTTVNAIVAGLAWMILFWFSLKVSIGDLRAKIWTTDVPSLPSGIILAVIPLGSLFLCVESIRNAYKHWNDK